MSERYGLLTIIALLACLLLLPMGANAERRDQWFRIRVPAYGDFFRHYNSLYRIGALANYWNLNVYDVQQTRPTPGYLDGPYYQRMRSLAVGGRIRLDPDLETAAPRFARLAWGVGESFMWTHHLHENAFDAYAAPGLSMEERRRMVESATDDYFRNPRALSDVEIPMERVRQLPYHGAFARNGGGPRLRSYPFDFAVSCALRDALFRADPPPERLPLTSRKSLLILKAVFIIGCSS
jgi:hypothetical protein